MEVSMPEKKPGDFGEALNILLGLMLLLVLVVVLLGWLNYRNGLNAEQRIETCRVVVKEIKDRPATTPLEKAKADAALETATTLCSQVL